MKPLRLLGDFNGANATDLPGPFDGRKLTLGTIGIEMEFDDGHEKS